MWVVMAQEEDGAMWEEEWVAGARSRSGGGGDGEEVHRRMDGAGDMGWRRTSGEGQCRTAW